MYKYNMKAMRIDDYGLYGTLFKRLKWYNNEGCCDKIYLCPKAGAVLDFFLKKNALGFWV